MIKVLVIDDDPSIQSIISYRVPQGSQVIQATSVKEAQLLVSENDFDIVIVDIMMPNESGLVFLSYIRNNGFCKTSTVVIFSCVDNLDNVIKPYKVDYLINKGNPRALFNVINNYEKIY